MTTNPKDSPSDLMRFDSTESGGTRSEGSHATSYPAGTPRANKSAERKGGVAPQVEEVPSKTRTASQLGKGYSYLFAIALTIVIVSQSVNINFKTNRAGDFEIAIASRELNISIFLPCVGLIAAILGLPTDAIALAFGKILTSSEKLERRSPPLQTFQDKEPE